MVANWRDGRGTRCQNSSHSDACQSSSSSSSLSSSSPSFIIVILGVGETDDLDVVEALLVKQFDEFFALVLVHVDHDCPGDHSTEYLHCPIKRSFSPSWASKTQCAHNAHTSLLKCGAHLTEYAELPLIERVSGYGFCRTANSRVGHSEAIRVDALNRYA
jgi:hypothetical protein